MPEVTLAYPFGHETLKAFGKNWVYWSMRTDAAVFKCDRDEREALMQADPDVFTNHPHYAPYPLLLVRPGHIDPDWAKARLTRTWRDLAPKRFLKDWDARHG